MRYPDEPAVGSHDDPAATVNSARSGERSSIRHLHVMMILRSCLIAGDAEPALPVAHG
jgi:hypothetical protein